MHMYACECTCMYVYVHVCNMLQPKFQRPISQSVGGRGDHEVARVGTCRSATHTK